MPEHQFLDSKLFVELFSLYGWIRYLEGEIEAAYKIRHSQGNESASALEGLEKINKFMGLAPKELCIKLNLGDLEKYFLRAFKDPNMQ